jgi:hypothetical protein
MTQESDSDEATSDQHGESADSRHGWCVPRSRRELLSTAGAVAGAGALAGCPGDPTSQTFEAVPVVLSEPGREWLGLTEFDLEESSRSESLGDVGEATIISYLTAHSRPSDGDPPTRFGVSAPSFRTMGALSTPSPPVLGEGVNPFATEPLSALVRGERGRQFLQRLGVVEDTSFDWTRRPQQVGTETVELLGSTTEAESYMGVATGSSGTMETLLMNVARVDHEDSTVLVGEVVRRLTPPNPIETDVGCVDDLCQMPSPEQVDMWRRYKRAGEYMATCTELRTGGVSIEVCGGGGGGGGGSPDTPTDTPVPPKLGIANPRLVQQVEGTVVQAPGGSPNHTESAPDLVKGEDTAVVFDFNRIADLGSWTGPLEIEVVHGSAGNRQTDRFEMSKSDLEDIRDGNEHTISVLHGDANDSDSANDNPVFELSGNPSVEVRTANVGSTGFQTTITPSRSVVDLPPLRVGFIALKDNQNGSRYGDSQGEVQHFLRSFRSALEYLQHAYPGDVVGYAHRRHHVLGKANLFGSNRAIFKDMVRADNELTKIAVDPSYPNNGPGFPNGGPLDTDGRSRSAMERKIRKRGFDIVVAIVPRNDSSNSGATGYYDYHNRDASGLAWANPNAAVSALGATNSGNDVGISSTTAQEIGHYFQEGYLNPTGHPMAQRRNKQNALQKTVNGDQIEPSHARHQNSSLRGISSDSPGVVSTAYDLKNGFTNMQSYTNPGGSFSINGPSSGTTAIGKVPSYMSYTGQDGQVWADARIHQQLIDSGWNAKGLFGGGDARYMLSGIGSVAENGSVRYDEVWSSQGVNRYFDAERGDIALPTAEDEGVEVALLGPGAEDDPLERTRVPLRIFSSHDDGDGAADEPIVAPMFRLPFARRGVQVRSSYDGTPASMNPIDRSVRDAVGRVPEAGFAGDPETARDEIETALDRVAEAMAERAYGEAADAMDGPVRERIQESVVSYESQLGEATLEGLLTRVDEMTGRLRDLAETTG